MNSVSKVLQQGPHGVYPVCEGESWLTDYLLDFVINYILYIVILVTLCAVA